MRDEAAIREELGVNLQKARAVTTIEEHAAASAAVKRLQDELQACITRGAEPCPETGSRPLGLRHVRLIASKKRDEEGRPTFKVVHRYEIGVDGYKVFESTPQRDSGPDLEPYNEPARLRAVERWNAGDHDEKPED